MGQDEQAIRQLIADWLQATRDEDVDRVLALMAPDVVFLVPGQAPLRGRAAFADGLRGLLRTHRIASHSEIEEVVVAGSGELAYCRTRLSVSIEAKDGGPGAHRAGHTLSILRKGADGVWLMVRDANLLVPQDAAPAPAA